MRLKLTIEPRPVSTWGITLASRLSKSEWDEIRSGVYRDADYKCQICSSNSGPLHAHEVWRFEDRKRIQRLVGFLCLCRLCHDVKHFGRSSEVYKRDYIEKLISHWCQVNGKTRGDFQVYLQIIFEQNKRRADKFYIVKVGRRILT